LPDPEPQETEIVPDRAIALDNVCYLIMDFEGTTPAGRSPQPIEVAVLALRHRGAQLVESGRYTSLIKPPPFAPLTARDRAQTGITERDLASARSAPEVFAELDHRLAAPPHVVVAHSAPVEAGMIARHAAHCPRLAALWTLDTIKMARALHPGLRSYSLDPLLDHLRLPRPTRRHRALPDAEATAVLFGQLLEVGQRTGTWSTLGPLLDIAGRRPTSKYRAGDPEQGVLFGA